jgi:hypothetical protein
MADEPTPPEFDDELTGSLSDGVTDGGPTDSMSGQEALRTARQIGSYRLIEQIGEDPVEMTNTELEAGELVKIFDWRELATDLVAGDVQLSVFDGLWTDATAHADRITGLGRSSFRRSAFGPFGALDQLNAGSVSSGLVAAAGDRFSIDLPWPWPTPGLQTFVLHEPRLEVSVSYGEPPNDPCLGLCSIDIDPGPGHVPEVVGGARLGGAIPADQLLGPMDAFYSECDCVRPAGVPPGPAIEWWEDPGTGNLRVACTFDPLEPGEPGYTCEPEDPCGDMHEVCEFLPLFGLFLDVDLDETGINESMSVGLRLGFAGTTLDPMPEIFADGFELGGTTNWSNTTPSS